MNAGNDVIHQLTRDVISYLYINITLKTGESLYELYHQFSVADEADKYRLFLKGPATGTLGKRERGLVDCILLNVLL